MKVFLLLFFALLSINLHAQEMTIQGTLEWERMEFSAALTLDLQKAGIKLPAGRSHAEALLEDEFPELIKPFIFEIQADSSSTVADLIDRGELSPAAFMGMIHSFPPFLSPDLSVIRARYLVNLTGISAEAIRHSRAQRITIPLIPTPVQDYSGIIIIADESLPVHGRSSSAFAIPCLFPKIWDSEMNLIFERNTMDPQLGRELGLVRYASRENIMRAVPSGMDEDLIKRVGETPLRIMAQGIFGAVPTDLIIDKEDALLILSSENNRRLLMEGRIAIVLDKKELKKTIP
ncbi:MAG: polymerase [Treponema sp.]|nr:polymerase [Treponema sp.]